MPSSAIFARLVSRLVTLLAVASLTPAAATASDWIRTGIGPCSGPAPDVGSAGDVDGDGWDDVFVAICTPDRLSWDRLELHRGSPSGLASHPSWIIDVPMEGAASAGDVDGDGFDDLAILRGDSLVLYRGSRRGPESTVPRQLAGEHLRVAGVGDIDGDGHADVLVGARPGPGEERGRAWLYRGTPLGLEATPTWTLEDPGEDLGQLEVAGLGDVQGDGLDDFAVVWGTGIVEVFLGTSSGVPPAPAFARDASHRTIVAGAGDLDGDGHADLLLGHEGWEPIGGRVDVHHGSTTGFAPTPTSSLFGTAGEFVARRVAGLADRDGDGRADAAAAWISLQRFLSWPQPAEVWHGSPSGIADPPDELLAGDLASGEEPNAGLFAAGDVDGDGRSDAIFREGLWAGVGIARLYPGAPTLASAAPEWELPGEHASAALGTSVAAAGDVDGDGYDDLLVASPFFDGAFVDEGRVQLFLGQQGGLATEPHWTATGGEPGALFGWSLAAVGDLDGDGHDDIAIGAPLADAPQVDAGRVVVYFGGPGGLAPTPGLTLEGGEPGAMLGASVAGRVDLDGDGMPDLAAGAPGAGGGAGAVLVVPGSTTGPQRCALERVNGGPGDCFGATLAPLGDGDGDGLDDLLVGDGDCDGDGVARVRLLGRDRTAGDLRSVPLVALSVVELPSVDWRRRGLPRPLPMPPAPVIITGDFDGDGHRDAIVGGWDGGGVGGGEGCFMVEGTPTGLAEESSWRPDDIEGGLLVTSLAAADLNGDGIDDLVVGAVSPAGGRLLAFAGGTSGLGLSPDWTFEADRPGAALGAALAAVGDADADGHEDVVAGAPGWSDSAAGEGLALAFLGNGGGLPVRPRVLRADGSTPVPPGGVVDAAGGAILLVPVRSPFGRRQVEVQWSVTPGPAAALGAPRVAGWFDTGAPGATGSVTFREIRTGPLEPGVHSWRVRRRTAAPFSWRSTWVGASFVVLGDSDGDGVSDLGSLPDTDGDGVPDPGGTRGPADNAPHVPNPDQADSDGDGLGDVVDPFPSNPAGDADCDGVPDDIDPCPADPLDDEDGDGWCADVDVCPSVADPGQEDSVVVLL